MMVIPTEQAAPLSEAMMTTHLVDAQLAGTPASSAVSDVLQANGYAVYQRPWGDWSGPFVQAASQVKA